MFQPGATKSNWAEAVSRKLKFSNSFLLQRAFLYLILFNIGRSMNPSELENDDEVWKCRTWNSWNDSSNHTVPKMASRICENQLFRLSNKWMLRRDTNWKTCPERVVHRSLPKESELVSASWILFSNPEEQACCSLLFFYLVKGLRVSQKSVARIHPTSGSSAKGKICF